MSFLIMTLVAVASPPSAVEPVVEVEELVYSYEPANNGSGPMWCHGSTCLVRVGDRVFASGLETLKDVRPLHNVRWLLFGREAHGWELLRADEDGRTREPCPLVAFGDGRFFLSANPTLTPKDTYSGPARPEIFQFSAADPRSAPQKLMPKWSGDPPFAEHSYRSFAADAARNEFVLFQNIGYDHAEWVFRDARGEWPAQGKLVWPMGKEYDHPQPIRICYPNVALKDRAVYFCGVSDIQEPYDAWRTFKKQLTGQEWDYDFRRLFFCWAPDITNGQFSPWVEIASRDKTCGWISPMDLWVAADGRVHILWSERALDERLRAKFFPGEKQSHALNYAIVRAGAVVARKTLVVAEEGGSQEIPGYARFQITPDQRMFVVYYVGGRDASGQVISENRLLELREEGTVVGPVRVPLAHPMSVFFTATWRGGSAPSKLLDLFGPWQENAQKMGYARVRLW